MGKWKEKKRKPTLKQESTPNSANTPMGVVKENNNNFKT
jgi:hypothetical protein